MPLPCPSAGLQRRVGRAAGRRLLRRLRTKETLIQMNDAVKVQSDHIVVVFKREWSEPERP